MKMPTDEVVKDAATFRSGRLGEPLGVNPEAYDRWLRLVKAEAWDEGFRAGDGVGTYSYFERSKFNPYLKQEEA